ncbi:recombinase family protein [Moritella viscosa]|uniref:Site-specific recombinase n=1 Tax=Moritella viscosa TaxID=80854 RepID=A0A1L0CJF2_9GAMM|nr:recombinase family protein [Moritella viscosa]SGZ17347.1 Site-specific recombinase [Moritella viscosa]
MEYILYYRVSTQQQGDSGLGLEAQVRDCKLYLDNYTESMDQVIGTFQDIASGAKDDRPQYLKAVALAEKTGATILVSKLDRISRSVSTIALLIERVNIKISCMPFADKFQLHLYAALAEQERDFISLRTKAALQSKRDRGESFNRSNAIHEPAVRVKANATKRANADAWKAKVLPMIKAVVNDTATYADACKILNEMGVKSRLGKQLHPTTISRILVCR